MSATLSDAADRVAPPYAVDAKRSKRVTVDGRQAVWVAVCAKQQEALSAAAKQAAVAWANLRHRVAGAIDEIQGPMADDGTTLPFTPAAGSPADSGVVGPNDYRRMAAMTNMTKASNNPAAGFVMFIRVMAYDL